MSPFRIMETSGDQSSLNVSNVIQNRHRFGIDQDAPVPFHTLVADIAYVKTVVIHPQTSEPEAVHSATADAINQSVEFTTLFGVEDPWHGIATLATLGGNVECLGRTPNVKDIWNHPIYTGCAEGAVVWCADADFPLYSKLPRAVIYSVPNDHLDGDVVICDSAAFMYVTFPCGDGHWHHQVESYLKYIETPEGRLLLQHDVWASAIRFLSITETPQAVILSRTSP